jgi:hypothetical protein
MAARPLAHGPKQDWNAAGRRTRSTGSTRPSIRRVVANFGSSFKWMRAENALLAIEARAIIRERKRQERAAESVPLVVLYSPPTQ